MTMKTIGGAYTTDGLRLAKAPVTVRFTSDGLGETLSLESANGMILVPFEQVKRIIEEERRRYGRSKG